MIKYSTSIPHLKLFQTRRNCRIWERRERERGEREREERETESEWVSEWVRERERERRERETESEWVSEWVRERERERERVSEWEREGEPPQCATTSTTLLCCKTPGGGQSRAAPGAEEGERGTGQREQPATHWRETAGGDQNTAAHNTTAAVCQHTPTAAPQPQLNTRGVSAHKHPTPPQTQLNSSGVSAHNLRAPHSCNPSVSSSPSEPQEERQQQHSDSSTDYNIIIHEQRQRQKRKDTIVILCDSNGHHLDPRRLFPGRSVKKFWVSHFTLCFKTTARGCVRVPPSHIIIHTGTNGPQHQKGGHHKSRVQRGENKLAELPQSQSHHLKPSTSQRRATKDHQRHHVEIANICAPIPNVHIANHQQVTHQHLYDHIHIHREGMRLFAKTIKASTLNSPQKTHPDREERVEQLPSSQTDSYAAVAARRGRSDSTDLIQIKNMLKIICDNLLA